MECLDTTKSLKINLKRNIGTVVVIVEGASDEFLILKQIFRNILHYKYIEKSRNHSKFKEHDEFIMKGNENSKVIVINTNNSNIKTIKDENEYKNEIYKELYQNYGIDINKTSLYIIWDIDRHSNDLNIIKELTKTLGNAQENDNSEMQGLLLLSYPSSETFIIDNFEKDVFDIKKKNSKEYIKEHHLRISDINQNTLIKSVVKMHKNLKYFGIFNYESSKFSKTALKIFKEEELYYNKKDYYRLLSYICLILIDLNIITER